MSTILYIEAFPVIDGDKRNYVFDLIPMREWSQTYEHISYHLYLTILTKEEIQ